jgi:hypothetical protein
MPDWWQWISRYTVQWPVGSGPFPVQLHCGATHVANLLWRDSHIEMWEVRRGAGADCDEVEQVKGA